MRWALVYLLVATVACYNVHRAEVRLPGNASGAECFASCQGVGNDAQIVNCVAACPGAVRDGCSGPACVEDRKLSKGKTALIVVAAIVGLLIINGVSSTTSSSTGGP